MARPKTIELQPTPFETTIGERLLGAVVIHSFVAIWLSSLVSPFLLLRALAKGDTVSVATIIGITIAAYAPWTKGKISKVVQGACNYYLPLYFRSCSVELEGDKIPTARDDPQTFYAVHPHGAFCLGWSTLFCNIKLQHVRFCFAPALYASPFFRLFSRVTGNPGSASKAEMISYMKRGESLALPPGGFEEATLTSPHQDRVFIKKRTGFVKLCLQHGIAIRPVYVFGEERLYWNIQGAWQFRLAMNKMGLPAILIWGHPLLPLLPRQHVDLKIVVGSPIILPQIDNPSKDVVLQWHAKYVVALTRLFEDHKEVAYGRETAKQTKLEVW